MGGSLSGAARSGDIRLVGPRRLPLGACEALRPALFYFYLLYIPLYLYGVTASSSPASDDFSGRQEISSWMITWRIFHELAQANGSKEQKGILSLPLKNKKTK